MLLAWRLALKIHVVFNDARALVTRSEISPTETYTLSKRQIGNVWIAIDPVELVTIKDGWQSSKQLPAREAAIVGSEEDLILRVKSSTCARLVVIQPKTLRDRPTVTSFVLGSLEDVGDESEWIPGKRDDVMMKAGSAHWRRSGIHPIRKLGSTEAKPVSIEW